MTATVRATATPATSGSGSSFTVNKPTGTLDGDILLLDVWADDGALSDFALPTGFNLLVSSDGGISTGVHLRRGWKVAASEGSTYTITRGASNSAGMVAILTAVQGADGPTVTPTPTRLLTAGLTVDAPTLTPSSADGLLICGWGAVQADVDGATITFTAPTSPAMTEIADGQFSPYMAASMASRAISSGSATGVETATGSSTTTARGNGDRVGVSTFIPAHTDRAGALVVPNRNRLVAAHRASRW